MAKSTTKKGSEASGISVKLAIPKGTSYIFEQKVESKDTAAQWGSGLIEVFATPAMVGMMEGTAQKALMPFLPEGNITLGIEINVKHLKATPAGMVVRCEAKVTGQDNKKLFFDINAQDEEGLIGTATHTRYIVQTEDFMQKLLKRKV